MQPAAIVVLVAILVIALAVVVAVAKYVSGSKTRSSSDKSGKKFSFPSFGKDKEYDFLPELPAGSTKRVIAILSSKMSVREKSTGKKTSAAIDSSEYVVVDRHNLADKKLICLAPADDLSKKAWVLYFEDAPLRFRVENPTAVDNAEEEPD